MHSAAVVAFENLLLVGGRRVVHTRVEVAGRLRAAAHRVPVEDVAVGLHRPLGDSDVVKVRAARDRVYTAAPAARHERAPVEADVLVETRVKLVDNLTGGSRRGRAVGDDEDLADVNQIGIGEVVEADKFGDGCVEAGGNPAQCVAFLDSVGPRAARKSSKKEKHVEKNGKLTGILCLKFRRKL